MNCLRLFLFITFSFFLALAVFAQSTVVLVRPHYTNPAAAHSLYVNHCASCHGADMKGAPAAAQVLPQAPPDLTTITARNHGTFPKLQVYEAIAGRHHTIVGQDPADMPGWAIVFRDMYQGDQGKQKLALVNLVSIIEAQQAKKN